MKEFKIVDASGVVIDTVLLDINKPIPENHFQGWGSRGFHEPIYDFSLKDWVESKTGDELLTQAKKSKDNELNTDCSNAILEGFEHTINGMLYWFSYDSEAQGNFRDAKDVLRDGIVTEIMWTVREGGINGPYTRIPVNNTIMSDLTLVIMQHKNGKISRYRDELLPQVYNATTLAEVSAITW